MVVSAILLIGFMIMFMGLSLFCFGESLDRSVTSSVFLFIAVLSLSFSLLLFIVILNKFLI